MNRNTKRWIFDIAAWTVGVFAIAILIADAAAADRKTMPATNLAWQTECGSCHVAFPPQLLPAASWRAIINHLDKHFGNDASVDPAAVAEISAFLESNASRDQGALSKAPLLRITDTRWFRHEHSKLPAVTWTRPNIKGPADCGACHRRAADGDFGERTLRLPN
jgi:Dihaem cytochrome c